MWLLEDWTSQAVYASNRKHGDFGYEIGRGFYDVLYGFITVYVTHQNWMVRFLETNRAKFDLCPDVRFIFLSAGVDHVVNYEMPLNAEAGNVGIFQFFSGAKDLLQSSLCQVIRSHILACGRPLNVWRDSQGSHGLRQRKDFRKCCSRLLQDYTHRIGRTGRIGTAQ
jgi:hypothetical protein